MLYYVISAPGGPSQPEMRGSAEEKAPGIRSLTANAPGPLNVRYSSPSSLKFLKLVKCQH
jgi:hypothetical protein